MGHFGLFYHGTMVEMRTIQKRRVHPIVTVLYGRPRSDEALANLEKAVKGSEKELVSKQGDIIGNMNTVDLLCHIISIVENSASWSQFLK